MKDMNRILSAVAGRFPHEARVLSHCTTDDDRLQALWKRSAEVNNDVQNIIQLTDADRPILDMNLRISLVSCAATALAWAYPTGLGTRTQGYNRVRLERERQNDLFRRGLDCRLPCVASCSSA